jgi:hypothetical protein
MLTRLISGFADVMLSCVIELNVGPWAGTVSAGLEGPDADNENRENRNVGAAGDSSTGG